MTMTTSNTSLARKTQRRSHVYMVSFILGLIWIPTLDAYNYNYNYNYNNDDNNNGGDDYYAANDDAANNNDDAANAAAYDDGYYNANANNDDANAAYADDVYAGDDQAVAGDDQNNEWNDGNDDFNVDRSEKIDDDAFQWNSNEGFDGVAIMPVSCVNYNNGHMIQFELFEEANSFQCRFSQIGTFVVSIAHYMRAYFNYQALMHGDEFTLPGDAGYLNCVMLQETAYGAQTMYAKIGCMERETFTSTKLSLHLYTDDQCSQPYDDGNTARRHNKRGYDVNGYRFPTKVSFRPPFYTCQTCAPSEVSGSFNKQAGTWYDDDYIVNQASNQNENNGDDENGDDANQNADDAYYQDDAYTDDAYMNVNDDVYNANANGDYYNANGDDYYNNRMLSFLQPGDFKSRAHTDEPKLIAAPGQLEAFEAEFWNDVNHSRRNLYSNYYDVGDWNMCQRVYKYGVFCDEDCRGLDAFRTDRWSGADVVLLTFLCTFISGMMLLIVAKRLKATQKQRIYGEAPSHMPGLPPAAMFMLFIVMMLIVVVLARLKFVNETLIFAVVTCILLFIYMLKLTLFDNRRPVLLAAPGHYQAFDNPMDARVFN